MASLLRQLFNLSRGIKLTEVQHSEQGYTLTVKDGDTALPKLEDAKIGNTVDCGTVRLTQVRRQG